MSKSKSRGDLMGNVGIYFKPPMLISFDTPSFLNSRAFSSFFVTLISYPELGLYLPQTLMVD